MKLYHSLTSFLAAFCCLSILISCEDTIAPELEQADPVLVVDAWINDKAEAQLIKLSLTQPYFENTLPIGVSGATIFVEDNEGNTFNFVEDATSRGDYLWVPPDTNGFGKVGNSYELSISLNGEVFKATSRMGRVPAIDSLTFTFEEENAFQPDSYIGEFWASDLPGRDDTYWVKSFKNGVLLNKPEEINLAYDAGFSAGGNFDGVAFITPIRRGVNPNEVDENDEALSPYQPGDSLHVEIHSITVQAFNFMNEVIIQTNRPGGFSELFATPLSNVSTNIYNQNISGTKVLGFFNVASVSSMGKKFEL
ncbi:MAG: DUF4249 domain-containing protein [Cyclobacteriaceae bacterium]